MYEFNYECYLLEHENVNLKIKRTYMGFNRHGIVNSLIINVCEGLIWRIS